jgi:hypothetical protein
MFNKVRSVHLFIVSFSQRKAGNSQGRSPYQHLPVGLWESDCKAQGNWVEVFYWEANTFTEALEAFPRARSCHCIEWLNHNRDVFTVYQASLGFVWA